MFSSTGLRTAAVVAVLLAVSGTALAGEDSRPGQPLYYIIGGAAIGGISGGTIGGVRSSRQNRQAEQQRKQWEKEQTNQYMAQRNSYNRAYAACLEGRGYTVK